MLAVPLRENANVPKAKIGAQIDHASSGIERGCHRPGCCTMGKCREYGIHTYTNGRRIKWLEDGFDLTPERRVHLGKRQTPEYCSDVSRTNATSGCRASRRTNSAPAYPVAPATATLTRVDIPFPGGSLPLRVLRPLAGLVVPVLLSFDLAWITSQKAGLLKSWPEVLIDTQQGA